MSLPISLRRERQQRSEESYTLLEEKINRYLDSKNIHISSPAPSSPGLFWSPAVSPSPLKIRDSQFMQKRLRLLSCQLSGTKKDCIQQKYLGLRISPFPDLTSPSSLKEKGTKVDN